MVANNSENPFKAGKILSLHNVQRYANYNSLQDNPYKKDGSYDGSCQIATNDNKKSDKKVQPIMEVCDRKPPLTWSQTPNIHAYLRLILLTSIACGLEFCVSAGFVYIPSLLMEIDDLDGFEMSIILSLAPLVGVITIPFIAKFSDDCQLRSGGRKPIIIFLSICVFLSLILLGSHPNIDGLLSALPSHIHQILSKYSLILGIFGLDYSTQICLNPLESLLSDLYKDTPLAEFSYAIYASMLALGSCVGYLIVALDWDKTYISSYFIDSQEQAVFFILAILFVVSLVATLWALRGIKRDTINKTLSHKNSNVQSKDVNDPLNPKDDGYESNSTYSDSELLTLVFDTHNYKSDFSQNPNYILQKITVNENQIIPMHSDVEVNDFQKVKHYSINRNNRRVDHIYRIVSSFYCSKILHVPTTKALRLFLKLRSGWQYIKVWLKWPIVLRKLFWAHLFMWTALMIHNLFYADFMGRYIFMGNPKRNLTSLVSTTLSSSHIFTTFSQYDSDQLLDLDNHIFAEENPAINKSMGSNSSRIQYDAGIKSASWGFLYHSLTAALIAPLVERFIINRQNMDARQLYQFSLFIFNGAMAVLVLAPIGSAMLCNFVTTITGLTLAIVNSIPFILLSKYNMCKPKYYFDQYAKLSLIKNRDKNETFKNGTTTNVGKTNFFSNRKQNINHSQSNGQIKCNGKNKDTDSKESLGSERLLLGIGADIAVLDIGFFLAQIFASLIIGQIIKLTNDPRFYMLSALAIATLGCFLAKNIIVNESELDILRYTYEE